MTGKAISNGGQKRLKTVQVLGLDPETVIDETISNLQDEDTSLDSYHFCVISLKNDAQSRIQRRKLDQSSDKVPYPERQLLVSKSLELRRILRSLLKDDIPLHSGAFSVNRLNLFRLYVTQSKTEPLWQSASDGLLCELRIFLSEEFTALFDDMQGQIRQKKISHAVLPYLLGIESSLLAYCHVSDSWFGTFNQDVKVKPVAVEITHSFWCWDGKTLGKALHITSIPLYQGQKNIIDLKIIPSWAHPDQENHYSKLSDEGRAIMSLIDENPCMSYAGVAMIRTAQGWVRSQRTQDDTLLLGQLHEVDVPKNKVNPSQDLVDLRDPSWRTKLHEDDYAQCYPLVPAFSISHRAIVLVRVRGLRDKVWPKHEEASRTATVNEKLKEMRAQGGLARGNILLTGTDSDNVTEEAAKKLMGLSGVAEAFAAALKLPLIKVSGEYVAIDKGTKLDEQPMLACAQLALRVASGGRAIVFLQDMDSFFGWSVAPTVFSLTKSHLLDAIQEHPGIVFISVQCTSQIDTDSKILIDYQIDDEFDKLEAAKKELEPWLLGPEYDLNQLSPTARHIAFGLGDISNVDSKDELLAKLKKDFERRQKLGATVSSALVSYY